MAAGCSWPAPTTVWHIMTRQACELERIKRPTRNPSSRWHSGLRPVRGVRPCRGVPEHLFVKAKPKVVAVIDDDPVACEAISRLLWPHGSDAAFYASAKQFLDAMPSEAICLIVGIKPGESCGIELAECLVNVGSKTPILVTTTDDNESFKRQAPGRGCVVFLPRPFSTDDLIGALRDIPGDARLRANQTIQGRAVDAGLFAGRSSRSLAAARGVLQQMILRIWRVWLRDLSP